MIVGGYTLDLYCDHPSHPPQAAHKGFFFADGPGCYGEVRRMARKAGWTLRKDGTAVCPACSGREPSASADRLPEGVVEVSVYDLLRGMRDG